MCACSCSVISDSLSPHGLMDCSPPGPSVPGIFQAGKLEWVANSSSKGSFQLRDWICSSFVSCTGKQILYYWATWEDHLGSDEWIEILLRKHGQTGNGSLWLRVSWELIFWVVPLTGEVLLRAESTPLTSVLHSSEEPWFHLRLESSD